MDRESLEETKLQIQLGNRLQLQQVGLNSDDRFSAEIIGYLAGESLIVKTPRILGKVLLVRKGQQFIVRMLQGNRVHGFPVSVLHSYTSPYPHLHLSYPSEFESIEVRNAPRVGTDIICAARNAKSTDLDENFRAARIIDLSNSGARMISRRLIGNIGEGIVVHFALDVCESEEMLILDANVRSLDTHDDVGGRPQFRYGLEFSRLNRFQKVCLHAHVLEQMGND